MYVAATRAKDMLIICYPGQEELPAWQLNDTGYRNGLSSFILALSEDVFERTSSIDKRGRGRTLGYAPAAGRVTSGFRPGDRVRHPAFGRGIISKFRDSTKVEVLFKDVGRKLLHLEHTTLEKF